VVERVAVAVTKRYKSINFDLDTRRLEDIFGDGKRRSGYAAIQRFLTKNGFIHRQWSGYVSQSKLTYAETYIVIDDFLDACPWLAKCANRFDVTDYMAESDAIDYIMARDLDVEVDLDTKQ
jgi:virulence-associated protein VapD